ncbi:MAG: TonB family protein [Zoogloeaceae bacterium]|nr:TonB family protein [Zoogloeaceae bacterium]
MPTPAIMVQWLPHASQASPGLAPLPVETFSERRKPIQRSTAKPQPPVEAQATERAERAPEIASPPVATNTTESTAATATSASPHSNGITEARQPHFSEPRFDADYLSNPAPAYPALSRRLGEEGKVILRVFVESSGQPGQIELKASSGSPRLDRAAQEAIRHWKFIPASRGQEAVGAWVLVPIVFTLKG